MQACQSDLGGAGGGLGGRGCTFRAGGTGARVDEQERQTVQAAMATCLEGWHAPVSVHLPSGSCLLPAAACLGAHSGCAGANLPARGAGLEAGAMEEGWAEGTCKLWQQASRWVLLKSKAVTCRPPLQASRRVALPAAVAADRRHLPPRMKAGHPVPDQAEAYCRSSPSTAISSTLVEVLRQDASARRGTGRRQDCSRGQRFCHRGVGTNAAHAHVAGCLAMHGALRIHNTRPGRAAAAQHRVAQPVSKALACPQRAYSGRTRQGWTSQHPGRACLPRCLCLSRSCKEIRW